MKVKVSKNAGFCVGVKRAVELVLKTAEKYRGKRIFTWGPIINNPQTVEMLAERGIGVMEKISDAHQHDIVVIRSHGIVPAEREALEKAGLEIFDATCPKVGLVHKIVREHCREGNPAIIVGDADHPEVLGIKGEAPGNVYVIKDAKHIDNLDIQGDNILVVAQTTMDTETFEEVTDAIKKKYPTAKIINTLCTETSGRQREITELSKDTDIFVIVGGKTSGNTKRLYERAKTTGKRTLWIESHSELNADYFSGDETVTVLSGASTPHWVIEQVVERLETMHRKFTPPWKWRWLKKWAYMFLRTNGFSGLAGGTLTLMVAKNLGANLPLARGLVSAFILLGVQNLYQHREWQGIALMDPSKIQFIRQNRRIIVPLSLFALLSGTIISATIGCPAILITLACLSVGVAYWLIPMFEQILPASTKDLAVIFIWWVLITGIGEKFPPSIPTAISAVTVLGARGLVLGIKEAETDRILQRKTITSFLGEKKSTFIGGLTILTLSIVQSISGEMMIPMYLITIALWILSILTAFRLLRHGTYIEALTDGIIVSLSSLFIFF